MTTEAITQSATTIQTTGIELNALKPTELASFYEEKIGLTLLSKDDEEKIYHLGTPDGAVLISIYPTTT